MTYRVGSVAKARIAADRWNAKNNGRRYEAKPYDQHQGNPGVAEAQFWDWGVMEYRPDDKLGEVLVGFVWKA